MKVPEFNNRQLITLGIGAAIVIVIIVLRQQAPMLKQIMKCH